MGVGEVIPSGCLRCTTSIDDAGEQRKSSASLLAAGDARDVFGRCAASHWVTWSTIRDLNLPTVILDQHKEDLETLALRWANDTRDKAERKKDPGCVADGKQGGDGEDHARGGDGSGVFGAMCDAGGTWAYVMVPCGITCLAGAVVLWAVVH